MKREWDTSGVASTVEEALIAAQEAKRRCQEKNTFRDGSPVMQFMRVDKESICWRLARNTPPKKRS